MQNNSGITPVEFNVLVKQRDTEAKTSGGLHLPQDLQDRNKHNETRGKIVAISPMAFNEDVWPVDAPRPEPGQDVAFARMSGTFIDGLDGEEYRVIKDRDIVGLIG